MAMPIEVPQGQVPRPPRFEFETRAEEDREASAKAGHVVYRDVDFVKVTPPGSYSIWEGYAADWLKRQEREPYHGLLVQAYEAFKQGKEAPLNGTAIELCTMFTPAEVKTIKHGGCRTVEDLAAWPDGSLAAFGMGAVRLKQKAQAWVASAKDTGGAAAKLDAQAAEIETLKEQVRQLLTQQTEAKEAMARSGDRPTLSLKKDAAA